MEYNKDNPEVNVPFTVKELQEQAAAGEPGQQAERQQEGAAAECGRKAPSTAAECGNQPVSDGASGADELQGTLSRAEAQQTEQELPMAEAERNADALWRAGLEAEMRPIAQRAGRKLFTLCASINNAHVGLGLIAQVAQQSKDTLIKLHARQAAAALMQKLHHTSTVLDQAIAALITGWAEASDFTREQIVEVQTDMLRARQLAQAAPPSGIVLPSGGH